MAPDTYSTIATSVLSCLLMPSANLALGLVWSIIIVYAVRELGPTAAAVGVALLLGQLGGFAGAALASRLASIAGRVRTCPRMLRLMYPSRTREALSVYRTSNVASFSSRCQTFS
jgi:hypothetical protein